MTLRRRVVRSSGFTLIEIVIYIALLGVILTGVIASTYPIFTGAEHSSLNITRDGEAAFTLRKISWALASGTNVSVPIAGTSDDTLDVTIPSGHMVFTEEDDAITLNGNKLTASRMVISNLIVTHTAPSGNTPRLITVAFDIAGANSSFPAESIGPVKFYVHF